MQKHYAIAYTAILLSRWPCFILAYARKNVALVIVCWRGGEENMVAPGALTSFPGPVMPRLKLGSELRQLREKAGLRIEHVAAYLECSPSKISRLETGKGIPKKRDVQDLLTYYEVENQHLVDTLLALAREGRSEGWWPEHSEMWSPNMDRYISLESQASAVNTFVSAAVHALIQTADYTREVFQAIYPKATPREIEPLVEVRMNRQKVLRERLTPLRLTLVVDEPVLYRAVGSRAIMHKQLEQLLNFSENQHYDVRIFPLSGGFDLAAECGFSVFYFDEEPKHNTAYVELGGGDKFFTAQNTVDRYSEIFSRVVTKCLSPAATRDLIQRVNQRRYE